MDSLIYDRTQSDVDYALNNPDSSSLLKGAYNYNDLNRIETWCEYLAQQLNSYNYYVDITTKTDWTMGDFPTKVQMKRIRDNVQKLKNAFMSFTSVPASLEKMTYQKANELEKVLYEIDDILKNTENYFVYSGVANSGQNRMWQQRFRRKYNHVLNILADGRFKNIASNYMTNTNAQITNQGEYTRYTMTNQGTTGYLYNIYTRTTFEIIAGNTYMYVVKWRNTEDYPTNNLGYYLRSSGSGILSRTINSHGTEWQTAYDTYTPNSTYSSVQLGFNSSNINQGANLDIEYQAFIDITDLDSNYVEVIKQNLDKMIAFPKVESTRLRGNIAESEGDLIE